MTLLALTLALAAGPAGAGPAVPADPRPAESARISIDVKDADIVDVVRLFAEVGGFQVVVDPGISCKLTLALKQVEWPRAFEVALQVCGLGQDTDGGITRVAPLAKLT